MWTWCSWFPLDGGGGAAHQKTYRGLGGGVVEDLVVRVESPTQRL